MAHLQTQTTPKKYVWLTGRVHILRQLGFPGNMSFNELDTKFFATKWIDLWIASWRAKRISIKQQIYVYLAICSMANEYVFPPKRAFWYQANLSQARTKISGPVGVGWTIHLKHVQTSNWKSAPSRNERTVANVKPPSSLASVHLECMWKDPRNMG